MHARRALVTGVFALAIAAPCATARADEPPTPYLLRFALGYTFGDGETAGLTVSCEAFRRVTGDGHPFFYDLGAVLALRGAHLYLGPGVRHTTWLVGDPRFDQTVSIAPGVALGARGSGRFRLSVAGSFGFQRTWPTSASLPAIRPALGLHLVWHLQASLARLAPTSSLGPAISGGLARAARGQEHEAARSAEQPPTGR